MIIARNKNFVIRTYRKTDAESIAKNANNKKIANNLGNEFPNPYSIKDAREWIKLIQKNQRRKIPDQFSFGIEINKKIVGGTGFYKISKEHHGAEMGYWLGEKYWGKGIMTKVVREITKYGFEKLKFKRIQAGVFPYNKGSMRVLEKAGYKFEGILRKNYYHQKNRKFLDSYIYAKIN